MREMKDSGIEWIGKIPKSKHLIRNKYLLEYTKGQLPADTNFEGVGVPYIGASDLDSNEPYRTYTSDKTLPDCCNDDLLVLWDGARAGLCGTHKCGKISSTIVRIREISSRIYRPFLYWYYKGFQDYMYQRVNGTTIPHMNRKYIEEIYMIDWTVKEQCHIADYLNRKCGQIDAIIAKQQQVIDKLKAYKLSVITEAVTKGLNPDVPMKDSGVDWIGKIPEHWEVSKMKYQAILNPKCNFSGISKQTIITYTPMECLKNGYYNKRSEVLEKIPSSLTPFEEGDIVMAKVTPCFENGNIAIMNHLDAKIGLGSSELFVFRAKYILTEYLFWFLQNQNFVKRACFTMTGVGGLKRVSFDFCKNCDLPVPPNIEQKEIVQYLNNKCTQIAHIIEEKQQLIDKLTEYKKSLIYEVVTGKKEV